MQVIRTRSMASTLRRLFVGFVVFLALMTALTVVFADAPDKALQEHVLTTSQLVHRGECDVESMQKVGVPCLILYDTAKKLTWLVLFDHKNGQLAETHVMAVGEDKKEIIVWCRHDVCA